MELFGHLTTLYGRLAREGLNREEVLEIIEDYGAKLCLTDALRCCAVGDNIVKFGRGYSHFTDGCAMRLPYKNELKGFFSYDQTQYVTGNGYRGKFADEPTDFAAFIRFNPEMFEKENQDWGLSVLSHLMQDAETDTLWQYDLCDCDTENDVVIYKATGKKVDGAQFRKDMGTVNIYIHMIFVEYIRNEFNHQIEQADIICRAGKSFDKWYTEKMADNTKKYLVMDHRIFDASDDEIAALEDEILATGLFKSRRALQKTSVHNFEAGMSSLDPLINFLVRMN